MRQMAQKMQQQEQEGEEKENEVDEDQLRQLLKSLVNSSFREEKNMQDLKDKTKEMEEIMKNYKK